MSELWNYLQQSKQIITDLMIGGLVLGIPLAVSGYVVTLRMVIVYRRRHPPPSIDDNPIGGPAANADRQPPGSDAPHPERLRRPPFAR